MEIQQPNDGSAKCMRNAKNAALAAEMNSCRVGNEVTASLRPPTVIRLSRGEVRGGW